MYHATILTWCNDTYSLGAEAKEDCEEERDHSVVLAPLVTTLARIHSGARNPAHYVLRRTRS
jgi:hypothetical protein